MPVVVARAAGAGAAAVGVAGVDGAGDVAVAAGVAVGAGVATSADVDFVAPTSGTTSGAAVVDADDALVAGAAPPPPPLGSAGGTPGHGGACVATTPADVAADDALAGGALPGHGGPPAGSTAPPLVRGVDGVPRIISLGLGSCAHAAAESNDTDTSAMANTRSISFYTCIAGSNVTSPPHP